MMSPSSSTGMKVLPVKLNITPLTTSNTAKQAAGNAAWLSPAPGFLVQDLQPQYPARYPPASAVSSSEAIIGTTVNASTRAENIANTMVIATG